MGGFLLDNHYFCCVCLSIMCNVLHILHCYSVNIFCLKCKEVQLLNHYVHVLLVCHNVPSIYCYVFYMVSGFPGLRVHYVAWVRSFVETQCTTCFELLPVCWNIMYQHFSIMPSAWSMFSGLRVHYVLHSIFGTSCCMS